MPWVCVSVYVAGKKRASSQSFDASQSTIAIRKISDQHLLITKCKIHTHTHLCIQCKWYCSQTLAARNQTRIRSLSWMGSENEQKFYDFYHVFNCKCIGFLCVFLSISAVLCVSHSLYISVSCFIQH